MMRTSSQKLGIYSSVASSVMSCAVSGGVLVILLLPHYEDFIREEESIVLRVFSVQCDVFCNQ